MHAGSYRLITADTTAELSMFFSLAWHVAFHRVVCLSKQECLHIALQITKSVQHPLQRLRMGDKENVMCLDPGNNRLLKFYEAQASDVFIVPPVLLVTRMG